jgi:hypothetical protein
MCVGRRIAARAFGVSVLWCAVVGCGLKHPTVASDGLDAGIPPDAIQGDGVDAAATTDAVGFVLPEDADRLPVPDRPPEPALWLYGSGIVWGFWLGLNDEYRAEWDSQGFAMVRHLGGAHTRGNFPWGDIEHTRGTYDWSGPDRQVELGERYHVTLFAYTGLTPDWALPPGVGAGQGHRHPPDDRFVPDFERFFEALSKRYCGKVTYYQFWNEQNGCGWKGECNDNKHDAATYAVWLKRWYQAMKRGCASTVLAVGGLDCNLESGVACAQYLRDLLAAGAGDAFDAVAIHPYGQVSGTLAEQDRTRLALNWPALQTVQRVLDDHGMTDRDLWLNEYGWRFEDESLKADLLIRTLRELEKPEYQRVFQATYLTHSDLPDDGGGPPGWGLADRDVKKLVLRIRESGTALRAHPKLLTRTP